MATKIDLLPYFLPDSGRVYRVGNSRSSSELFQVQRNGRWFFHVKNAQFEELFFDDGVVGRALDTSPGSNRVYIQMRGETLNSANIGAAWIARFMSPGEVYQRNPYIYWRTKDNKPVGANGWHPTPIKLVAHYVSYTFKSGITLEDVVEILWDVPGGERYWYAKDYGLVAWKGEFESYIVDPSPGISSLQRESIPWYEQVKPREAPILIAPVPPIDQTPRTWQRAQLTNKNANIRSEPRIASTNVIGALLEGDIFEIDPNKPTTSNYTWFPIRVGELVGWIASPPAVVKYDNLPNPQPLPNPDPKPPIGLASIVLTVDEARNDLDLRQEHIAINSARSAALTKLRDLATAMAAAFESLIELESSENGVLTDQVTLLQAGIDRAEAQSRQIAQESVRQ
jgi:hypothetical protein